MIDPIIKDGIVLRDRLNDIGGALETRLSRSQGERQMNALDGATCKASAIMLQTFGTEVTRLRTAIDCFLDGRLDRTALRGIAASWNADGKHTVPPAEIPFAASKLIDA